MTGHLFIGINAPLSSDVTVTSSTLDLTTVTAASWEVTRPGGEVVTWAATLGTVTATSLKTTHLHATGDVPRKGSYSVRVLLTTPGGVVPCEPEVTVVTH